MPHARWTTTILLAAGLTIALGAALGNAPAGAGAPANDDCNDATPIGDGVFAGDTTQATNDGAADCGDSATSPDVWFAYTADRSGILHVDTCGTAWDTVLSVHEGCPGTAANQIACNDDACNYQSMVTVPVESGVTYWIRVAGWQGANGPFTLTTSRGAPIGGDVTLGELNQMQQVGRVGDVIAASIDSPMCNAGDEPIDWYDIPDPRHPFMNFNMYRLSRGRFQQIGQSWSKHGWSAAQGNTCGFGCTPNPDGTRLGVGCSDTYSAGANAQQQHMGPRSEIDPFTGAFSYQGSHIQHDPGGYDAIQYRLQVHDADLSTDDPDAEYYCEVRIVTHDDADHMNSGAWERVDVTGAPGGVWSFDVSAAASSVGPAIEAWSGATLTTIPQELVTEGRVILGATATANEDGSWHYEYAVYDHDLGRGVGSFLVPIDPATAVTNVGFAAVQSHDEAYSNAPWSWSRGGAGLTWATTPYQNDPHANPIRWGTLYNFWFDANRAPAPTTATLGVYEPGSPSSYTGPTTGPALGPAPGDLDGDGDVDFADLLALLGQWGACPPAGPCPGDLDMDGAVTFADLLVLLGNWG